MATAIANDITLEEALVELVNDPLGHVYFSYPWGEKGTILEHEEGPDEWQIKVLTMIAKGLPIQEAIRVAVRSGHGIGKTTLIAWIIKWFMDTRPFPQVVVTANTKIQLETKTWRELSKWHNISETKHLYTHTGSQFYRTDKPKTWQANAIPWVKEKSEAFAGTHESHILYLFDEGSAIDDTIWEVSEGAMTGNPEGGGAVTKIFIAFGNPTRNTGRFSECFKKYRHRWTCLEIDSRDTKRADKNQIDEWAEDYGEDSDFFRVRVKGQEPRAGISQFIPNDIVENAMGLSYNDDIYRHDAKVMGVDIAGDGDDQTVIYKRQGLMTPYVPVKVRGYRTPELVDLIAKHIIEWGPTATFIDVGFNPGVADMLAKLKFKVVRVNFGATASNSVDYANKRAEMWGQMKDWLENGGAIPPDNELRDDLIGPEYGYTKKMQIQLERKVDMKKRGIPSPDIADALALTFAYPVKRTGSAVRTTSRTQAQEHDIYSTLED
jgi:hypothetical protein